MNISQTRLQLAIQQVDPSILLLQSRRLTGGISATMMALDVQMSDGTQRTWVLRAHGDIDRQQNPNIARDEYRILTHLQHQGLPVPFPIHLDETTDILPVPYMIIQYIEHDEPPVNPSKPLAKQLAQIHQVDSTSLDFLPHARSQLQSHLNQPNNHPILQILRQTLPQVRYNPTALLHGDYWSGNVLWRDGKIVAVIDWEDMMRGDPLVDLGKSRLEILWAIGESFMTEYTIQYQSQMVQLNYTYLPFWDLWGAWRLRDFTHWFDDDKTVLLMQTQYDEFVGQAIQYCEQLK